MRDEDILGLEVPMQDALRVDVTQRHHHLHEPVKYL
jgi:hypothetical protein